MAYTVPELMLIGTANSLVLISTTGLGLCEASTDTDGLMSGVVELW